MSKTSFLPVKYLCILTSYVELCLVLHIHLKTPLKSKSNMPHTWVQCSLYCQTCHYFTSTSLKIYRANLPAPKPGQYSSLSSPLRWAIITLSIIVKLGERENKGRKQTLGQRGYSILNHPLSRVWGLVLCCQVTEFPWVPGHTSLISISLQAACVLMWDAPCVHV